jgi:very-short-patch-repair endonuclease
MSFIQATLSPRLNLAFHQNSVPFLRELTVVNETEAPLQDIEITLASDPPFLKPRAWRIESVSAGQTYHLPDLDVAVDGPMLARLIEAERAQVVFTLKAKGATLNTLEHPVELLARNQWGGIGHVPEMIAAFVLPNDPAVERILKKAADVLRSHGKDAALNGYERGPKHAWELASAIWAAIGSMGIDYALPPASFEHAGQKVRTPGQIAENGLATCLDFAVLCCAALEQCGLNPLLVFTQGHAFAGVWLKAEDFTQVVVDDITALRKRIKLNELVLFETTLLAQRPCPAFSRAAELGAGHITEAEEEKFELAIDLRRARMQRIKPLAAAETASSIAAVQEVDLEPVFEEAPDIVHLEEPVGVSDVPNTPKGRLDRWQRKLLDLSLRNGLLNFRASRWVIALDAPDPGKIDDLLADGHTLKLLPRPDLMDGSDPRDRAIHEGRHQENVRKTHALEALSRDELLAPLSKEELESRLIELYRNARAALQEGGANTLFLALGFLTWRRDEKDEKKFRAPLILLPVSLHRKSVRSGFSLTLHDDEPRFNPTLLEMLRQDFNLSLPVVDGELPKDDHGLDIAGIWKSIAHAVKDIKGWEVSEDVVLATFSFAKYLMWKDLTDRTDQLKQNPVVRHLIETPRDPYPSGAAFPDPRTLDSAFGPEKIFCPLPADSSQLSAIVAAVQGKDFVLVGPPGTGKSQTISNLIAQCLAEDKTVLFVSEKIAALDVVYRRLREVGLGEFCLELHSSKAKKTDVLEQLRKAWDAKGSADAEEWRRESDRLGMLRSQLNRFVERLHLKRHNGLTAYGAVGRVVAGRELPALGLSWPSPDVHDVAALASLRELAERLDVNAREVGSIADSPLSSIRHTDWSPGWQQALIKAARDLIPSASDLERTAASFCAAAGLPLASLVARKRDALASLATILPEAAGKDWRFALRPDARALGEELTKGLKLQSRHADAKKLLSVPYKPEATRVDLPGLKSAFDQAQKTWGPLKWWKLRPVAAALASVSEGKQKPDIGADLDNLAEMRRLEDGIAGLDGLREKTGGLWLGLASSAEEIGRALSFQRELAAAVAGLAGTADELAAVKAALERLLGDGNPLLEPGGSVAAAAKEYGTSLERFRDAVRTFAGLAGTSSGENVAPTQRSEPTGDSAPSELAEQCRNIVKTEPGLHAWCAWRKARREALVVGMGPLVAGIEDGRIAAGKTREIFETDYCRWWLNAIVDSDEALRGFVSAEHEKRILDFRALDERFTRLTREYLRMRLCGGLPNPNEVTRASEWGLLRREMEKKRRHLPLRELIGGIPEALTHLTPCLLMSPLSIAQYLPAGTALFDVVIFDEASQIPVWDAVGAIARGKQVVMVGDPKQLPPTSFFERANEEADDDVDIEGDMESILDECLGANLPTMRLSWHYRSKHESLIAFSNHRYYGGGLVTFPSPVTEDRAVSLQHIAGGVYEKGGARINKPEAQAMVADLVRKLKDPEFEQSKRTVGVVTFNGEQQRLIEDLLDEERRKDPALEPFFAEDALEPVFVKNLESVQGDERDVMYFSLAYGPDKTGTISMNFGPMNREGGERRLNVAVTRARHELRIFSSLRPDQIDLSRTGSSGVKDLKHFLEFAERGPRALAEAVSRSQGDYESPFESAVAQALAAKGWRTSPQVGVSSFRIDLGIVDPRAPGRFLAGLECDGATYHRSATARDRDKLREQVLRGLGWEILRIWSTDWWLDAQSAIEKTHMRLLALAERRRTVVSQGETSSAAKESAGVILEPTTRSHSASYAKSEGTTPIDHMQDVYHEVSPEALSREYDPESFYEPAYDALLESLIGRIVAQEAPIREDILAQRIARAHGWLRTGARIRERVLALAKKKFPVETEDVGIFIWPAGHDKTSWPSFRKPVGTASRSVDEIAFAELIALAREIRTTGHSGEGAIIAMSRAAGLQQLRAASKARLEKAWQGSLNS